MNCECWVSEESRPVQCIDMNCCCILKEKPDEGKVDLPEEEHCPGEEKGIRILQKAEQRLWLKMVKEKVVVDCLRCPHQYDEILCIECEERSSDGIPRNV